MTRKEQRRIAEKYAPIFRQEIGWRVRKDPRKDSPPETDFITSHDFDRNPEDIPTDWMPDYKWQSINLLRNQDALREKGRIQYHDWGCEIEKKNGQIEIVTLDLRGVVYYAVMATETNYFIWYLVFHAKDTASTHDNDLEGSLVIVDRDTELVIGLQAFGHNQTMQYPVEWFWKKVLNRSDHYIDKHRKTKIEGFAKVILVQDGFGERQCCEVWIEMWGHGHRGARIQRGHLDRPIGYVAYYPLDFRSFPHTAPPFNSELNLKEIYDYENLQSVCRRYLLTPFGDSLTDNSLFARSGGNKRPITWRDENGGSGLGFFARPVQTLLVNFGVEQWRDRCKISEEYTFNPYRR